MNTKLKSPGPKAQPLATVSHRTLYGEAIVNAIGDAVRRGVPLNRAAEAAGIDESTLHRWKERHGEFAQALTRARADFIAESCAQIGAGVNAKGLPDWKARAWLLERRFPREFGAKAVEAPPAPAVNVNVQNVIVLDATEKLAALQERRRRLASPPASHERN